MKTAMALPPLSWPARIALLAALLAGLAFAAPVAAQDDFGHATITLYAPGAPATAWASVQWQDRNGTWRDVQGWQAALEVGDGQAAIPFKQWAVYPRDYGRGPFRWVVTQGQGGPAWATSGNFFLPNGSGAAHTLTVSPTAAGGPTDAAGTQPAQNFNTITILAPGAPDGAWVGVQWRGANGRWNDVAGWQAPLEVPAASTTGTDTEAAQASLVPTQQFGVFERDYGTGPFRWIIYDHATGEVFGTSQRFFLPRGGGANLTMTVLPQIAIVPADTLAAELPSGLPTLESANTSSRNLSCAGQACDFSVISISVPNAPAGSLVGVQWQDSFGLWHDVLGWQGSLSAPGSADVGYQQWTIGPELQGRGPFRWVLYNALGDTVLGATPGFMLPDRNGVNVITTLPSAALDIAS